MRKRQFCFNLRDALNGEKLVSGTHMGDTMEEAAVSIARSLQLVIEIESPRYVLWRKDRRVNLHVTAIPEHVLLGKIPEFKTEYPIDVSDDDDGDDLDDLDDDDQF